MSPKSEVYAGKLFQESQKEKSVAYFENDIFSVLDTVICGSSEHMTALPDSSIHLMITSPPYNVGKDYDSDLSLDEYREFLRVVWLEVARVLVPGGRACINIGSVGRKPTIPLHTYVMQDMLDLGFLLRADIVWDKAFSASLPTAWGSWRSASNPVLRDAHEYILVFSKDSLGLKNPLKRPSTITSDEFLEYTRSVWHFQTASAKKIGHPAPFPVELPSRLIKLYSFEGNVILDPFIGSGTTGMAAKQLGRHYVGYETVPEYCELANGRIGTC